MIKVLKEVNIVDVEASTLIEGQAIVIENGRIVDVTRNPVGGEAISFRGAFLCPGLVDAHVHLVWEGQPDPNSFTLRESVAMTAYRAARSAWRNLEGGVTTVRDVGGPHGISIALAEAIEQGISQGARVLAAGSPVVQTGGHVYSISEEADGPDEVRKAVRRQIKAGAHLIKLMCSGGAYTRGESIHATQLTPAEIRAAVEEAKAAERRVAAHALPEQAIQNALEAGVTTVEHAALLSKRNLDAFCTTGAFMVPTLAPYYLMATRGREMGVPDYAVVKSEQVMEHYPASLQMAFAAGVRIALGTDAGSPGIPHPTVPFEAWLWQSLANIPAPAILRAATLGAAEAVGLEQEIGRIQQGYWADFVVYRSNPLEDITVLHHPEAIFQRGAQVAGGSTVWSKTLLG